MEREKTYPMKGNGKMSRLDLLTVRVRSTENMNNGSLIGR